MFGENFKHQELGSVKKIPTFKCPYCSYRSQRSYIYNHIYKTHKDMRKHHPDIKARYNCEHCEDTFHGKGSKDHHERQNTLPIHFVPSAKILLIYLCILWLSANLRNNGVIRSGPRSLMYK